MTKFQIYNAIALTIGAGTDILPILVDVDKYGQLSEFILGVKAVGNATPPGAARTVTLNLYWSDELLAQPSDAPTVCALRKFAGAALAIANSASATRQYQVKHSTGLGEVNTAGVVVPFRPLTRFLYVTLDKTTEDVGAITTLTVNLVKLRSIAKRLSD